MHIAESWTEKLPSPLRLFLTLLVIVSLTETLIMVLLPYFLPGLGDTLQALVDAFFLAIIIAPFAWFLVVHPFRVLAQNEISRTEMALDHIVDAVINFNEDGGMESLNPAAEAMFGYTSQEILGQAITRILPDLTTDTQFAPCLQTETTRELRLHRETSGCRKDGSCFPVEVSLSRIPQEGSTRTLFIAIIHDISARKQYESQLEYQANHDALTNLPNRNLLADRILQALLMARRSRQEVVIFVIDLDNFKVINDSLGHDSGDAILQIISERLATCVRSGDTVSRLGGDEFVVMISEPTAADRAALIADKIREAIALPLTTNEHELVITGSIGISIAPKDGDDVRTLLKNADVAMYRAKEHGRNTFQFFTGEMNARSLARMTMEKHLRRALEQGELLVYYQPKVNLSSGQISGMEALARWQSPELGMVSPANFIPLAEETGLIEPIGEWVLRTACQQNKAWQDAGLPALPVAVNLSARQLRQTTIADQVRQILQETGLAPQYLELEITESMVMRDVNQVLTILTELKDMGLTLAMDDFGTGYSSLSYLKRFPFAKLKIDQSFVRDLTSDPNNAAIATTVIAMAHSLHLHVIAEGVETEGQLSYLRAHGCDEIQGYYFSRPLPVADCEALLRQGRRLPPAPLDDGSGTRTVLVVDDEPDVTASLHRMLTLEGYHVLTAASAAEGFELLATHRVMVVIADQRMPVMTGTEFLGRVKELYPGTTRIILSGHADLESVTEAINHGAVFKFLHKPWDDNAILATVDEACQYHQAAMDGKRPTWGRLAATVHGTPA